MSEARTPTAIEVSPAFKWILITVIGITAVTFATNVLLVVFAEKNEDIKTLINACSDAWKGGVGAVFGLVAGKAT
jgi:hypothetical protein